MARTTISIPDDLKAEMDALGEAVNWSATAAGAFRLEIERKRVRREQKEGERMMAARARLKASREEYLEKARERGHAAGLTWAQESAEYEELKRLSAAWAQVDSCETNDAFGAPGVFLRWISNGELGGREDIDDFWGNLDSETDEDQYSAKFWDGFVEGALEIYAEIDED